MRQYLILPHFKKQLKPLCRKYRHLKNDLIEILEDFNKSEHQTLKNSLYKIRMKCGDIPRGKNKSFRLIVFLVEIETQNYIIPITIYYKSDKANISLKEINKHLEIILFEARFLQKD